MPNVGDQVSVDGIRLKVLTVNGRRIKKIRITKVEEGQAEPATTALIAVSPSASLPP